MEEPEEVIPMSFQVETKARRILNRWRDASEAHIRSDLQRASNEASGSKDQRISLNLKAIWNNGLAPRFNRPPSTDSLMHIKKVPRTRS
jgi:hypothetical protein